MPSMQDIIPIHEAKTNLSKLVKQAVAGKTIYIGAYGQPQAIITAIPQKKPIKIGIYSHKYKPGDFEDTDIIASDSSIAKDFNDAVTKPFPYE